MKVTLLFIAFFIAKVSPAQQYDLKLRLSKDSTYYISISGNSKINEIIEKRDVNIDFTYDYTVAFVITGVKENGYTTDIRYTNLKMSIGAEGKQIVFNSTIPKPDDKFSSVLASLTNHVFHAEMSAKGELLSLDNIDAVFFEIIDKVPDVNEEQKQKLLQQIIKAYGDNAFRGNYNMLVNIFPPVRAKMNETWEIGTPLETGLAATSQTYYTLIGSTENSYRLTANAILKTADKDAYMDLNGLNVKYDLSGLMKSNLTISKMTGWITQAEIIQTMTGNAGVEKSADVPNGMMIPMIFNGLITADNHQALKSN